MNSTNQVNHLTILFASLNVTLYLHIGWVVVLIQLLISFMCMLI